MEPSNQIGVSIPIPVPIPIPVSFEPLGYWPLGPFERSALGHSADGVKNYLYKTTGT